MARSKAMSATTETKVADVKKLVGQAAQAPSAVAATAAAVARKPVLEIPAQARVQMEKNMEQVNKAAEGFFKAAEEAAEFGRGNVEAVTKATQVYVAGVQDLGRQTMAFVQGLTDQALEGAKALSTVKSLKEATDIQATFARSAFERSFAETAKLQEAALKLAEQSFAPISARVTLAVEKLARPIAA
jgi:phasin family protein